MSDFIKGLIIGVGFSLLSFFEKKGGTKLDFSKIKPTEKSKPRNVPGTKLKKNYTRGNE